MKAEVLKRALSKVPDDAEIAIRVKVKNPFVYILQPLGGGAVRVLYATNNYILEDEK